MLDIFNLKDYKVLVADLESDGLLDTITQTYCISCKSWPSKEEVLTCTPDNLGDFNDDFISQWDYIVFHNGIGFDHEALIRTLKVTMPKEKIIDTLVLSRLANPSREGGHSLDAWGKRLGNHKGDFNDWSHFSPEMLEYCLQDTDVGCDILSSVVQELQGFSQESIDLEHEVQWIISQQERNGFLLDEVKSFITLGKLLEKRVELEDQVHETFIPLPVAIRDVEPKYKKDGTLSIVGLKALDNPLETVWKGTYDIGKGSLIEEDKYVGCFTLIDWPEFNLGSRQQIAARLVRAGWKPKKFTEKGNIIVDEDVLKKVKGIPEVDLIKEFMMIQKREAMLRGWMDKVDSKNRVHGSVNPIGTPTSRATHSSPNIGQIISNRHEWGPELRSCWIVDKGHVLIDADLAQLEQRMLAHYLARYDDGEFSNVVLNEDIHTYNQEMAGLPTRDQAKTFGFALIYGGGDAKIGSIIGGGAKEGKKIKETYFSQMPAFGKLYKAVTKAAERGFLKGLDGRKIYVRSPHSALNFLLQSAGAIVSKIAIVEYQRILKEEYELLDGKDYKQVAWIHDAITCEVPEKYTEIVGEALVRGFRNSTDILNLRCPQDGDFHVGSNFADVH